MGSEARRRPRHPKFELRILVLALVAGLPAVLVAVILLVAGDFQPRTVWTLAGFVAA
jgi:hypothetical protein